MGGQDDVDGTLGCLGREVLAAAQGPVEQRAGEQIGDKGVVDAGGSSPRAMPRSSASQTERRRGAMYSSR
jgi:hypothetical protein